MKPMKELAMSKSDQTAFNKYFPKRGILYQPGFGIIFGVNAGILLSQLLYWHGKGKKRPWTYKTIEDMYKETGLSITKQKLAIKVLVDNEVLEVKLKGVPATRHFKVNTQRLNEILPSLKKTCKLDYPNPPNYYAQNKQTITKITRQTTTETGTEKVSDILEEKGGIIIRGNVDYERQ